MRVSVEGCACGAEVPHLSDTKQGGRSAGGCQGWGVSKKKEQNRGGRQRVSVEAWACKVPSCEMQPMGKACVVNLPNLTMHGCCPRGRRGGERRMGVCVPANVSPRICITGGGGGEDVEQAFVAPPTGVSGDACVCVDVESVRAPPVAVHQRGI